MIKRTDARTTIGTSFISGGKNGSVKPAAKDTLGASAIDNPAKI
jgi:hypothetical protein